MGNNMELPPCIKCGGKPFFSCQDVALPHYYQIGCSDFKFDDCLIVQGETEEEVIGNWIEACSIKSMMG